MKKEIDDIGAKKQAMQEEITRILGSSGTTEELLAKNEALKKENDAKVEEIEQISKEADVAKKAAAESQTLIGRLKQQQATRTKSIQLASRTGTVVTLLVGAAVWVVFAFWAHGALIGVRPFG